MTKHSPDSTPSPEPSNPQPPLQVYPRRIASVTEGLLRNPGAVLRAADGADGLYLLLVQAVIALVCLAAYGLTAGLFSGGTQLWAAPLKITAGAFFSALICFPSFFIFACLAGVSTSIRQLSCLMLGLLSLLALLLLGFAPVSWIFAQSTNSLIFMGILHLLFWVIALRYGLRFLLSGLQSLGSIQQAQIATWIIIFVLVVLQMSTALRPILGQAPTFLPTEKRFFAAHWLECCAEPEKNAKKTRHTLDSRTTSAYYTALSQ
jgi:hypothetical protein